MLPALAALKGWSTRSTRSANASAFRNAQTERVFEAAQRLGLPVKLHAEQLSDQGGAALVARYRGLSADHLEHLSRTGIAAMAAAGTVAVLLPGALLLPARNQAAAARRRCARPACRWRWPPTAIRAPRRMTSLLLAMNMACTLLRLTPQEALAGATHPRRARAGHGGHVGHAGGGQARRLRAVGHRAPGDLAYAIGFNPCRAVVNAGVPRAPLV